MPVPSFYRKFLSCQTWTTFISLSCTQPWILAPLPASWKTHWWRLLINCDGCRPGVPSIMRWSSRCGVLGCHLGCSTGLSSCHSFCPLPAGAHPTGRCPVNGVQIASCKALTQQRKTGRIVTVDPEITGDPHHGFSKSTSFCGSKRAH